MTEIFIAIIAILTLNFCLSRTLEWLNLRSWKNTLPTELEDFYDREQYKKAQQYHQTKGKLGLSESVLSFVLLIGILSFGGFGWLNDQLEMFINNEVLLGLAFFGVLFMVSDLLSLPFAVYDTFKIEADYGFNKTTGRTFIKDKLKSYLLTFLIGGGLLALMLWLMLNTGKTFWIYLMIVIVFVSVLFNMFYTSLVLPWFNKLEPLKDEELKSGISSLSERIGFSIKDIFVIDGSTRSTKANAFFSGFGNNKRIVLYDTLINDHTKEELLAILAHEIGHYKKQHIPKNMILSTIQSGILFFLLAQFLYMEELSLALGASEWQLHLNLLAFAILYEPVSILIGLFMNSVSRKFEYQADAFAANNYDKTPLIEGLKKLSTKHLSNLTPHPAYVFFHYSHPPILERIKALQKI